MNKEAGKGTSRPALGRDDKKFDKGYKLIKWNSKKEKQSERTNKRIR